MEIKMRYSATELRARAKELLKGNYKQLIVYYVITYVILIIVAVIYRFNIPVYDLHTYEIISLGNPKILMALQIFNFVFLAIAAVSIYYLTIGIIKGKYVTVFEAFLYPVRKRFIRNIFLHFLVTFFTFLWSLLFIIPGIMKAYSYSMSYYILSKNPNISAADAFDESQVIMRGNRWKLFVLDLSYIGWYFLVVITFGFLLFWVVPRHATATTLFYENLYNEKYKSEKEKQ